MSRVSGSSSGIGQAAAEIFAKEGAFVTLHGQNAERMQQSVDLLKKQGVTDEHILVVLGPIEEDKTRQTLVDSTVKKFGKLDVLVGF